MNPNLFVYGTLMSHTRTEKALALLREATSLGPATMAGQLFRVTWYPGLVPGAGRVHGEVFRLHDPAQSLPWLDAYEGIVPGDAGQNRDEYERCEREVVLASGAALSAWVYIYCRDVAGLTAVADGRWTA